MNIDECMEYVQKLCDAQSSSERIAARKAVRAAIEASHRSCAKQRDDLLAALDGILKLECSERDEWDAVERVIPEMSRIARTAIASVKGGAV